jgi:hypothetical protein
MTEPNVPSNQYEATHTTFAPAIVIQCLVAASKKEVDVLVLEAPDVNRAVAFADVLADAIEAPGTSNRSCQGMKSPF